MVNHETSRLASDRPLQSISAKPRNRITEGRDLPEEDNECRDDSEDEEEGYGGENDHEGEEMFELVRVESVDMVVWRRLRCEG